PYTRAKTDTERANVKLDYSKAPDKVYLPRFQALATKAKGTEAGAQSLMMVLQLSGQDANGQTATQKVVDQFLTDYLNSPALAQVAEQIQYRGYNMGQDWVEKTLHAILEKSSLQDVKAAALYSLAVATLENQQGVSHLDEMKAQLQKLKEQK